MDVRTNRQFPMTEKIRKFIRDSSWTRDLLSIALLLIFVGSALAATITVTNNNDDGAGSLRQAINDSSPGDTIDFDSSLNGQTITLTTGSLVIDKILTITGPGANLLTVDGNFTTRVFTNNAAVVDTISISGLTIANGNANYGGGILNNGSLRITNSTISGNSASIAGGGIYNYYDSNYYGSLSIANSTLSGNSANHDGGGGIWIWHGSLALTNTTLSNNTANGFNASGGGIASSQSFLTITNSTLSGNGALGSGGGISSVGGGLTITNSTLSGNSASVDGGGISNYYGFVTIANSTLSGNSAPDGGGIHISNNTPDVPVKLANTIVNAGPQGANIVNQDGVVISLGYNLSSDPGGGFLIANGDQINTDPQFTSFAPQDNGGPTFTLALQPTSPAINAGDPNFNPNDFNPPLTYDQRGPGFSRVSGSGIDIGALELQTGPTPSPTPTPTPTPTATATFTPTPTATPTATATPTSTPAPTPTSTPTPTPTPHVGSADLLVGLGVDNLHPKQGDLITYTITVRNFGPDAAINAIVNDLLSSGTTFYRAQANRGHFTTPPRGQTGTVTWYVGDILNNGQESAQISVTVIVRGKTTITNTASVASNTSDPNMANNTASLTISVSPGGNGH